MKLRWVERYVEIALGGDMVRVEKVKVLQYFEPPVEFNAFSGSKWVDVPTVEED